MFDALIRGTKQNMVMQRLLHGYQLGESLCACEAERWMGDMNEVDRKCTLCIRVTKYLVTRKNIFLFHLIKQLRHCSKKCSTLSISGTWFVFSMKQILGSCSVSVGGSMWSHWSS